MAGGLSQSSVNDKAGAKTPLALVLASVTIGLCLMYLTGLLSNLPNVVLAAIVLVAVKGLIDIGELRHLWRVSRFEFGVSMVAFAGVLLLGILKGVMVAVAGSILLLIRRAAHPHVAFLGRIPGTRSYSDIERNPDNEVVPGVLLFRVEASLLYFNVEHVRDCRLAENPLDHRSAEAGGMRSVHFTHRRPGRCANAGERCTRNSRRWGCAFGSSQRMRRCAISCVPKDWRNASATSAAGSRWLMSSTSYRAAQERGPRCVRSYRRSSVHANLATDESW